MSFNIRDIDPAYVRANGPHYNYNTPRKCQAVNRQRVKAGLKPIMKPTEARY